MLLGYEATVRRPLPPNKNKQTNKQKNTLSKTGFINHDWNKRNKIQRDDVIEEKYDHGNPTSDIMMRKKIKFMEPLSTEDDILLIIIKKKKLIDWAI